MLRTHYRQPMDWTFQGMKESWSTLERFYGIAEPILATAVGPDFLSALCDDLNTPLAISELHKAKDTELAGGLGLLGFSGVQDRISSKPPVDPVVIADAIADRERARKSRNFAEADRIRDALLKKGILLKDLPGGTTWEVKR